MVLPGGLPCLHNYPLKVGGAVLLRAIAETELAVGDLRRKTDDLSDDGETTESSHQWTDEVESEVLEESEVLSDVRSRYRHAQNAVAEK